MKAFPRLLTAMVTPFKDDLSIDFDKVQQLALHLIENGSGGLVISGTTGESPTLSIPEKVDLFKAIKEAVGDKTFLVAGTGNNSTAESIEITEASEDIGYDAIMAVAPYYNKPNQEGLYQHFKTLAQATKLPIILYNIPGRTGINILPETVLRLTEIPNIKAIKEACGNLDQVSVLKNILPGDFPVYSGDDSLTLPMLSVGCHGVISVTSHIIGREMASMIEHYVQGRTQEATRLHNQFFPLFRAMFVTTNPIPVKSALEQLGLIKGGLRLPMVVANAAEKEAISKELIKLGLLK